MTEVSPRERIEAAHTVAAEIGDILRDEGRRAYVWQQRMRQVRVNLEVTDATEEEILEAARERFDSMYGSARDFSDFYLHREDSSERVAANRHFSGLVERLRALLHDS